MATIRRRSHRRCSIKKSVLRNFAEFTRKHLCQSLFLNKFAGLRSAACNFIKKETQIQVFSCEFCKIFKNIFITEHIQATASGLVKPSLNSDLYLIFKTSGTALLETIVSHKLLPSLSQENKNPSPSTSTT